MFLITYLAHPSTDSPAFKDVEGAYINAWIDEPTYEEADKIASAKIQENDWVIETIDESREVTQETYSEDAGGLQYFEQAKIDKHVFVYHTWPHGGDDDQTIQ